MNKQKFGLIYDDKAKKNRLKSKYLISLLSETLNLSISKNNKKYN